MVRYLAIIVALVALCATSAQACNYGAVDVGQPAFSIVQAQPYIQPVVQQQVFAQQVYAQPFVQRQVVVGGYRQAFVQPQRIVVRRAPLVRVRAPFVAVGY